MAEAETRIVRAGERPRSQRYDGVGTAELVTETVEKAKLLALKEIELAKADAKAELRSATRMAAGLGTAGVCAIMMVTLLLVAGAFALTLAGLPGWAAALIAAGVPMVVGAIAGLVGWSSRVTKPMQVTRRSLQEGVRWARDVI